MKKEVLLWIIVFLVIVLLSIFIYKFFLLGVEDVEVVGDCLTSGEIVQSPAGLGKRLGECCVGLIEIGDFRDPSELGSSLICAPCGNGACNYAWENKYNCPEDCDPDFDDLPCGGGPCIDGPWES